MRRRMRIGESERTGCPARRCEVRAAVPGLLLGGWVLAATLTSTAALSRTAADERPAVSGPRVPTAQTAAREQFVLEIDVLVQPQPSYRINAQQWGRAFQELGYVVRFRDGRAGERARVEDLERSSTPTTLLVGIMEADGAIVFQGRKYRLSQPAACLELFERLQTWGAAGPPSSSPTWGLTEAQFAAVTQLLSVKTETAVTLRTPMEAIDSLALPNIFRLQFTEAARERAFAVLEDSEAVGQNLQGISKGTALAIALAQFGLGYRPQAGREAGEGYILEVDVGDESSNLWPVGWKTKEALGTLLPALYRSIPVEVDDVEVSAFVQVIADKLGIPWYRSTSALQAARLDLTQLKYSRKPDKVSPSRLLILLGDKFQLGLDVRTDESGRCFLWVTTRADFLAFRQRFAHVVPGRP